MEKSSEISLIYYKKEKQQKCIKCGKRKVETMVLGNGHTYHICEKCRYIQEQKRYCEAKDGSYDFKKLNRHFQWVHFLREELENE